ncbi:Fatty acyl-CoA reductase [Cecembia lonarensis LW9]|uniref:Fatty acyl-CoA reductase n=2 Tax=Cecembia TaxID=1187078 RepID=K1L9I4_CECL9|nr:Fatty acyl-CoA reductase [Cecembia lonarensis LW9]
MLKLQFFGNSLLKIWLVPSLIQTKSVLIWFIFKWYDNMKLAITGPTSGIGAITFQELVPVCEKVYFLARNAEKANLEIKKLRPEYQEKVQFIPMDLADLETVKTASEKIQESTDSIDVLINNAGGIFSQYEKTKDGFELSFSANHLGHFLLTNLLLPQLLESANPKVINVSSEAHRAAKVHFDDLQFEKNNYSAFNAYANVKLFNILFSKSLKEKFGDQGLKSYALHPGVVKTNFGKEANGIFKLFWKLATPFMIDANQGARTSIFLAKTQLPDNQNGYYYKNSKPSVPSREARSQKYRDKLWEISLEHSTPWMS